MYNVLIYSEEKKILSELKYLDVLNGKSNYFISNISQNIEDIFEIIKKEKIELIISEIPKKNKNNYIDKLKENACQDIIIVGSKLSLEDARFCIINKVRDYFVLPFESNEFLKTFERIRLEKILINNSINAYAAELADIFNNNGDVFIYYADNIIKELFARNNEYGTAESTLKILLKLFAENIFKANEWLELYVNIDDIMLNNEINHTEKSVKKALENLYKDFKELFPNVKNNRIRDIMLYILNNPESDIKQKNISEKFYMNSSYLSTIFTENTEIRFVDFLTNVKLKRAAWLLKNTNLKIANIAEKVDYKDIGYFSRLFKKKYGVLPSDYRIPDNYMYCI